MRIGQHLSLHGRGSVPSHDPTSGARGTRAAPARAHVPAAIDEVDSTRARFLSHRRRRRKSQTRLARGTGPPRGIRALASRTSGLWLAPAPASVERERRGEPGRRASPDGIAPPPASPHRPVAGGDSRLLLSTLSSSTRAPLGSTAIASSAAASSTTSVAVWSPSSPGYAAASRDGAWPRTKTGTRRRAPRTM